MVSSHSRHGPSHRSQVSKDLSFFLKLIAIGGLPAIAIGGTIALLVRITPLEEAIDSWHLPPALLVPLKPTPELSTTTQNTPAPRTPTTVTFLPSIPARAPLPVVIPTTSKVNSPTSTPTPTPTPSPVPAVPPVLIPSTVIKTTQVPPLSTQTKTVVIPPPSTTRSSVSSVKPERLPTSTRNPSVTSA